MSNKHFIIPIFVTHEGCPHNCVFCNQKSITGSNESINENQTVQIIESYLKTINSKDSVIEVSFFGGTFTAIEKTKQNALLSIAKSYKDNNKIQYIRLSTRPDYINDSILTNLKSYSVDIIELGVQSMDDIVLRKSGRGHSSFDVIKASRLIKSYGFVLGHQIMLGLPGDTPDKDLKTVNELITLKPDLFRVYPSLVIKNTPLEEMYNNNLYSPYSLETAIDISKKLFCLLTYNNIKIIRMGLQPTENINFGKDIIVGPFHAAFRELVEGSLYCDMLLDFYKGKSGLLDLYISSKEISRLYTNKKQYFNDIKNQLNTLNINVKIDDTLPKGSLYGILDKKRLNLSIYDYICQRVKEG